MTEKDELINYLTLTKSLAMLYINGAIESSNKSVRKLMLDGLDYTLEMQEDLYNTMVDIGYYKTTNVDKQTIEKLCQKLNQEN